MNGWFETEAGLIPGVGIGILKIDRSWIILLGPVAIYIKRLRYKE